MRLVGVLVELVTLLSVKENNLHVVYKISIHTGSSRKSSYPSGIAAD